jgi:hypothetical protein
LPRHGHRRNAPCESLFVYVNRKIHPKPSSSLNPNRRKNGLGVVAGAFSGRRLPEPVAEWAATPEFLGSPSRCGRRRPAVCRSSGQPRHPLPPRHKEPAGWQDMTKKKPAKNPVSCCFFALFLGPGKHLY